MPVKQPDLDCDVVRLSYDFEKKTGVVVIAEKQSPDYRVTDLFEAIDPDVESVEVFSGDQRESLYRKTKNGWDFKFPKK